MAVVQTESGLVSSHQPWSPIIAPAGSVEFYSQRVVDYAAIYRTQPNVRLCIRFLARNMAQLNLKGYRRLGPAKREELDRSHALSRAIRRPNPWTTRHRFIRALVEDLKIFDRTYWLKARNPDTGGLRLIRVPPQHMVPVGDSWIKPDGFKFLGNRDQPVYPADAVIHLHGHNPDDPLTGQSTLESIRRLLAEEDAAGEWREQYWRGAGRMSGVIERPLDAPKWKEVGRNRFRDEFQAAYAGSGAFAGTTPILEEGMQWKSAAFSPKESEYLGARRLSREEAAAAFFIPPAFVGILEHANFSNMEEQHLSLYQDTLGPDLDFIEEDLELQLVSEFDDVDDVYLEFNLAEKLKGSFEAQARSMQTMVGAPIMSRNEGRAKHNLPPIDGGDDLVVPLNVLVGGQASPRDSAPPPAGTASRGEGAGARPSPPRAGVKSLEELPADVRGWAAKHEEILGAFFERQRSTVLSRLGGGQTVDEAFDQNRWDTELGQDLLGLASTMADEVGAATAETFGGDYEAERSDQWLATNARIAAEEINATTRGQLVDAFAGGLGLRARALKAAIDDEEDVDGLLDTLDPARAVFAAAVATRVPMISVSRVTAVSNFARREGAEQAGVRSKTWRVNSTNSRHTALDGETVPIGDTFSNGGLWPGDPALGVDDTANCLCSLEFSP